MTTRSGVWDWSYDGGMFEVSFADNGEFVCKTYPEHSHWNTKGSTVTIDWGKFGNYTMTVSGDGLSMAGCYTGYPEDWRKGVFKRDHTAAEIAEIKAGTAHAHSHSHNESCSHDH